MSWKPLNSKVSCLFTAVTLFDQLMNPRSTSEALTCQSSFILYTAPRSNAIPKPPRPGPSMSISLTYLYVPLPSCLYSFSSCLNAKPFIEMLAFALPCIVHLSSPARSARRLLICTSPRAAPKSSFIFAPTRNLSFILREWPNANCTNDCACTLMSSMT